MKLLIPIKLCKLPKKNSRSPMAKKKLKSAAFSGKGFKTQIFFTEGLRICFSTTGSLC